MTPKIESRPMKYQFMRRRDGSYANLNPSASYHGSMPFVKRRIQDEQ